MSRLLKSGSGLCWERSQRLKTQLISWLVFLWGQVETPESNDTWLEGFIRLYFVISSTGHKTSHLLFSVLVRSFKTLKVLHISEYTQKTSTRWVCQAVYSHWAGKKKSSVKFLQDWLWVNEIIWHGCRRVCGWPAARQTATSCERSSVVTLHHLSDRLLNKFLSKCQICLVCETVTSVTFLSESRHLTPKRLISVQGLVGGTVTVDCSEKRYSCNV